MLENPAKFSLLRKKTTSLRRSFLFVEKSRVSAEAGCRTRHDKNSVHRKESAMYVAYLSHHNSQSHDTSRFTASGKRGINTLGVLILAIFISGIFWITTPGISMAVCSTVGNTATCTNTLPDNESDGIASGIDFNTPPVTILNVQSLLGSCG